MIDNASNIDTHAQVREYYGEAIQSTMDLKTQACCPVDALPDHLKAILHEIDDEIITKFYGCGSPIPPAIEGCTVLDLGCGTGRDAYVASRLVGSAGRVIGVDMTKSQLDVARRHIDAQMTRFGYTNPNVEFHHGVIEDLTAVGIADESVDVVISNCVINLSPDKRRVFAEILRVLKPGGELYFSDILAGRRVPEPLMHDPVLCGECLSGALYTEDFRRLLRDLGVPDYRTISSRRIALGNPEIEAKAGMIPFSAETIRLFKLRDLEDRCEDYGQVATYRGTIPFAPHAFALDGHHTFESGRPMSICGNTAAMLQQTRLDRHFTVAGNRSTHFGPFPCDADTPASDEGVCC